MTSTHSSRRRRRLWRFADAQFDEASWALSIGGAPVALEGKPLEVLHELLLRAGEVVTKDEILDAVWPGVTVVEGSLATAISKLRKVFGDEPDAIIRTVPRVGYRLVAPVEVETVETPLTPRFAFAPGDSVPGRKTWQLERPLGDSGTEDVWLARQLKTGETRVFKFADAPDRLRTLKREVALSRLLFAGLDKQAPLPPLLEWNFDSSPFFLEYAWGGIDLLEWSEKVDGLAAIPLDRRIAVGAMIARAVEAIHCLGVLHKDLKPANILLDESGSEPRVLLVDFGSGRLLDDALLASFRITDPGSLDTDLGKDEPRSGTLAYRAPELIGDAVPTPKSDIYALGLILYQLVVGDFSAALAPGWEAQVDDPLLRADIAAAAAGAPERRLGSAAMLADRLDHLEERRAAAAAEAERDAFVEAQRRLADQRAARAPWVKAAFASLAAGFLATSALAAYAWAQRDRANTARELAETSYSFISEDILASPDPARSSTDERVVDAIKRASLGIDQRFARSPGVAARLHLAVARAFHQRADPDTARFEYRRAEQLFAKAGEANSDEAIIGRLDWAQMDATSGQPARLEEAGASLKSIRRQIGARGEEGAIGFALARAEGAYGYMADVELAKNAFRRAVEIGETQGSGVSPTQLLKARSSLVLVLMRLGRVAQAEPLARAIVRDSERVRGKGHPDTLVTRQHWLNSLVMLGRHEEALTRSNELLAAMQKRFGPDHRFTLALNSTRFESFSAIGRYEAAAHEAGRVWKGASSQAGPRSHQALVGQIDTASALCRTAQRAEGLRLALDAVAVARGAFGPDYALTHAIRYYAAECLIQNGRFAEGAPLLEGIDRSGVGQLIGNPAFGANVDVALAEIALKTGDFVQAKRLLASPDINKSEDEALKKRAAALFERMSK